jgi:nucleoside-diphosphate-sugar epimerase
VSRQWQENTSIRWTRVDVADTDAVAALIERVRPDVVFHLAAFSRGTRALGAVLPSIRDSVVGAANVFVPAARLGIPVLLAGSMEEPEGDAIPASPYAAAKKAVGSYARMLHALHGLDVVTLRLFMVYGPGHEDAHKLVPHVVTSLLRGDRPRLSSGVRPVDWIYVDDVIDAFMAAAGSDRTGNVDTLDVGSGELVTIRDLVEQVCAIMNSGVEPLFGGTPDRPLETVRVADVATTRRVLGWAPTTGLYEGLVRTIDWYRANPLALRRAEHMADR